MTKPIQISSSLFQDLRSLIIEARQDVARQVNSALVLLYWQVGSVQLPGFVGWQRQHAPRLLPEVVPKWKD